MYRNTETTKYVTRRRNGPHSRLQRETCSIIQIRGEDTRIVDAACSFPFSDPDCASTSMVKVLTSVLLSHFSGSEGAKDGGGVSSVSEYDRSEGERWLPVGGIAANVLNQKDLKTESDTRKGRVPVRTEFEFNGNNSNHRKYHKG